MNLTILVDPEIWDYPFIPFLADRKYQLCSDFTASRALRRLGNYCNGFRFDFLFYKNREGFSILTSDLPFRPSKKAYAEGNWKRRSAAFSPDFITLFCYYPPPDSRLTRDLIVSMLCPTRLNFTPHLSHQLTLPRDLGETNKGMQES
jgi:hypothetical protein